jgi:hypothetical protein
VGAASIVLTSQEMQQLDAIGAPGQVAGPRYAAGFLKMIDR